MMASFFYGDPNALSKFFVIQIFLLTLEQGNNNIIVEIRLTIEATQSSLVFVVNDAY